MRVAVVGSRDFPHPELVRQAVRGMASDPAFQPLLIVSGGARGPDTWAVQEAKRLDAQYIEYVPDWTDRGAGFRRNSVIVEGCDAVLAFWSGDSRGTKDTMDKARKAGKRVVAVLA